MSCFIVFYLILFCSYCQKNIVYSLSLQYSRFCDSQLYAEIVSGLFPTV